MIYRNVSKWVNTVQTIRDPHIFSKEDKYWTFGSRGQMVSDATGILLLLSEHSRV